MPLLAAEPRCTEGLLAIIAGGAGQLDSLYLWNSRFFYDLGVSANNSGTRFGNRMKKNLWHQKQLNQSKLNQKKLNQSKLNQRKVNQKKLNQSKLNQSKLNQSKLNHGKLIRAS